MRYAVRCVGITALVIWGLGTGVGAFPAPLHQNQQPSDSLVEAARLAREQQKRAPKASVVWTNDNLPNSTGDISIVGPPPVAKSSAAQPPAKSAGPTTAQDKTKMASAQAQTKRDLHAAKVQLKSLKTDLNILQRRYDLDATQYYGTPDYASHQQGHAKLDGEKVRIAAKQKTVDAAQKKVADLEKQMKTLVEQAKTAPVPQS